jgi:hypothetical protein
MIEIKFDHGYAMLWQKNARGETCATAITLEDEAARRR